jgi:hypothetical protein
MEDIDDMISSLLGDKPIQVPKGKGKPAAKGKPASIPVKVAAAQMQPEVIDAVLADDPPLSLPVDDFDAELDRPPVTAAVIGDASFTGGEHDDAIRIPMPKFVTEDIAESIDIRNFATLCTLQTRRWHAKVKDRKASRDAATANNAVEAAFETRKRLLVGVDDLLKVIHKEIDAARASHYLLTVPWTTTSMTEDGKRTGARLLPNSLFFEYTKVMAQHKADMVKAVNAFVPIYPSLIQQVQAKLGKRFDPTEYPNPSEISSHFELSFDFQPIPKGEDFKGLPQQQIDMLSQKLNARAEQQVENAMQDVWARLYTAMTHMYDRLSSPDKTFHGTLTEKVQETARLLTHLNVTKNLDIEKIRTYLDKFITPHSAEDLRKNANLRTVTAAHVKNVIDKMDKIGGKK